MNRIHFDVIDSTNDYAKVHFNELDEGTVIDACFQTKGRGRANHVWESSRGDNLLATFILKPRVNPILLQQLTQVIAKSMIDLLLSYGVEAMVKWPNDIYVKDQKIAGILIESLYEENHLKGVVVGIGFNVFRHPRMQRTICLNECVKVIDRIDDILHSLYNQIFANYQQWLNGGYDEILEFCNHHSYLIGKFIEYNQELYQVGLLDKEGYIHVVNEDLEERMIVVNQLSLHEER